MLATDPHRDPVSHLVAACPSALRAHNPPRPEIFLYENGAVSFHILMDPQVTALACFLLGKLRACRAPRTWPPLQVGFVLNAEGRKGRPCQVKSSPRPWKRKARARAQSQEGPPGKRTDRPWGQAFRACSGQEFSRPGIAAVGPPHSCPRPELATPTLGDWTAPPWEPSLEDAVGPTPYGRSEGSWRSSCCQRTRPRGLEPGRPSPSQSCPCRHTRQPWQEHATLYTWEPGSPHR